MNDIKWTLQEGFIDIGILNRRVKVVHRRVYSEVPLEGTRKRHNNTTRVGRCGEIKRKIGYSYTYFE